MNKKGFSLPVGINSLAVILSCITIVIFALLCSSEARASSSIGKNAVDAFGASYLADTRAEEILADLRSGKIPEGVTAEGNIYTYTCPITGQTELYVKAEVQGSSYRILTWQQRSCGDWIIDTSLPVWTGTVPLKGY